MAKFNNENKRFSSAPNALINDDTIPDRARFIYVYMNAKPEGWEFFHEPMAKALGMGVDTMKKYIDILVERGWLDRGPQQNENGKFGAVEYTLKAIRKKTSNKNTDTEKYRNGKIPQQDINSSINTPLNEDNSIISNPVIDKERKRLSNDNQKAPDELFEKFWESYAYKRGKDKAIKAWKRLTKKEKDAAIKCIPVYKEDCLKHDRNMKYPSTYLNGKTWEDDFDNDGMVSDGESFVDLPEGLTQQEWERANYWMLVTVPRISGFITAKMHLQMVKMTHSKADVYVDILKEIEASDYDDDLLPEFERLCQTKYKERIEA